MFEHRVKRDRLKTQVQRYTIPVLRFFVDKITTNKDRKFYSRSFFLFRIFSYESIWTNKRRNIIFISVSYITMITFYLNIKHYQFQYSRNAIIMSLTERYQSYCSLLLLDLNIPYSLVQKPEIIKQTYIIPRVLTRNS